MVDASTLPLLLAVLAGWLDRREQEVLRYLIKRIASCAASCVAGACS